MHNFQYKRVVAALISVGMVVIGLESTQLASAEPNSINQSNADLLTASMLETATNQQGLDSQQITELKSIASSTWNFYEQDVDPTTHLPMDNLGPGNEKGSYTSSANIGVYLWAIVSASDLGIISKAEATSLATNTLTEVKSMDRYHGFLTQWYDTATGKRIVNPGQGNCPATITPGEKDNCNFLSAVDNGWYASGLVVVRRALPHVSSLATALLSDMDFSVFYDSRAQTSCNVNSTLADNPPTGQQYGGLYVGSDNASDNMYHNGAQYSDPRISMYMGMGLGQMPGDVWWKTWRTLAPQQCDSDPDFTSWEGQIPQGFWTTVKDPISGGSFNVFEGNYTYPDSSYTFLPTYGGGQFEALMANEIVPETTWGTKSYGIADRLYAQVQIRYATDKLGYKVWGISPSSTADDTGGYNAFGATGKAWGNDCTATANTSAPLLAQGANICDDTIESTVTPHASFLALDVAPQQAYDNIQTLMKDYPGIYSDDGGFYDAVNPTTGSIGHRRLVLDQSMIMAAIDNAVNNDQLKQWFASDATSDAAKKVLAAEDMGLVDYAKVAAKKSLTIKNAISKVTSAGITSTVPNAASVKVLSKPQGAHLKADSVQAKPDGQLIFPGMSIPGTYQLQVTYLRNNKTVTTQTDVIYVQPAPTATRHSVLHVANDKESSVRNDVRSANAPQLPTVNPSNIDWKKTTVTPAASNPSSASVSVSRSNDSVTFEGAKTPGSYSYTITYFDDLGQSVESVDTFIVASTAQANPSGGSNSHPAHPSSSNPDACKGTTNSISNHRQGTLASTGSQIAPMTVFAIVTLLIGGSICSLKFRRNH
ncbi:glucoamylase family protein [Bifidobacterium mongoliense]|uniref:Cellobiose phosphorylase n=1 Tax=Bifidobacterium mongoliense DSM 21395 TaxID=1437603 RepID=A0A087C746_9BIFI|nr:glucoamylase family protein [Bifidobacterium mongoliense]KFI79096.1 cellobiose phosphorylase [Bifidobacterium mongoliense DSM 21395]